MENVNTNLQHMPKIKLYHQEELDIADKDMLGEDDDQELEYELRMYGMDKQGNEYILYVNGIYPSIWVKVPMDWANTDTRNFIMHLREKVPKKYMKGILGGKSPKCWETHLYSKLYGFDNYKKHKFIKLYFKNIKTMRKVRGLWYENYPYHGTLKPCYPEAPYRGRKLKIYECNLPTMLLYFHDKKINTAGWITFNKTIKPLNKREKLSKMTYEYNINKNDIIPLDIEDNVPLKVCSWDIEAKSSHGDFPIPKKSYKKLATELVDSLLKYDKDVLELWNKKDEGGKKAVNNYIRKLMQSAFRGITNEEEIEGISKVYLKPKSDGNIYYNAKYFNKALEKFILKLKNCKIDKNSRSELINKIERWMGVPELDKYGETRYEGIFPQLAGDEVTMIGSTFVKIGEKEQYLNHMCVVGDCDDIEEVPNREIEIYDTEEDMLLGWSEMIGRELPNIMIGYYIFGFDWTFLIQRVEELNCKDEFLENLSRFYNEKTKVVHKSIRVASGTHNDIFVNIEGCLQIDLASHFRKNINLDSYKLDNVASHFIGDKVKDYSYNEESEKTLIKSGNLMGLKNGDYIAFKIEKYSVNYYKNGKKFIVYDVDKENGTFTIKENIHIDKSNKIKWCMKKDDVTPEEMFNANTPSKRAKVAKYCYQDCNLVHNLLIKNDIYTEFSEMANLCSVPLNYIIMRGQGIKCFSFINKKCREKGVLIPAINKGNMTDAYEGAICLPPKCAFYADNPIAVNDYSSLYPSSMISENISHDSKVWWKKYNLDGEEIGRESRKEYVNKDGSYKYDNIEGYDYVDIEYDTFEYRRKNPKAAAEKILTGKQIVRFVQPINGELAVMPSVLKELLGARKKTKKLMKACKESFMRNVLDKRQLAFKLTANSLYGQCGAKTSAFYEVDIAASTTAIGRKNLIYAKAIVERNFKDYVYKDKYRANAEYIYGDSVTPDTPLLLRNKETGMIEFKQIDDLSNEKWRSYDGFKSKESNRREKQQNNVDNYEIYTSKGWSNIKRVIRHKTIKKMYRITTHTGMVDVTEDHSLLSDKNEILKPTDVKKGMKLLHNYPIFEKRDIKLKNIMEYIGNIDNKSIKEKEAFIWGFFYGDGSCGKYDCSSGVKYSWCLNQKNIETCILLQSLLMEVYNETFKINDTINSSNVYKIVPNNGNIKKYVEMYRNKFYNKDKYKIIPTELLNGDYNMRYAYFAGYYAADGSKCENNKTKSIRMDNKGKIGSAMLYYLTRSLGLNVSLNTRKDKLDIIRLNCTSKKQRKNAKMIKKIEYIGENVNDFVYDIETEVGNFNTGFQLIVKNTDSVFYTFNLKDKDTNEKIVGKDALKLTIEMAKLVEDYAGLHLKGPHTLEYEKTFMPLLLLSKKRYVGMLYEEDINSCYRKEMGIVLKRRDNAPCVKDCYGGVVDILMKKNNVQASVDFVNNYLNDMLNGHIKMDKLIISKKLNAYYKNPSQIAHKVLADRMAKRDPGNKPAIGSRLPYVYIKTDASVKLQGNKIESPEYIKKNGLQIDYEIYVTNQLMKPLLQLFGLVLPDIQEFKSRVGGYLRRVNRLKNKYSDDIVKYNTEISKIRDKEVKILIFDPILKRLGNKKSIEMMNLIGQQNMMKTWCNKESNGPYSKHAKPKKKIVNDSNMLIENNTSSIVDWCYSNDKKAVLEIMRKKKDEENKRRKEVRDKKKIMEKNKNKKTKPKQKSLTNWLLK